LCVELELKTLTPSGHTLSFIISMCEQFCDDLANYVVHDSLGDLEVNELDQELEEFMMHMKIQILECFFLPFTSFVHGFDWERKHFGPNLGS